MPHSPPRPVVYLVNMPYAQLATPSVAVGLLKAKLDEAELSCRVLDAQIHFAERIGPGFYSFLITGFPFLIGEWTFSGKAFPDFAPKNDLYVQRVAKIMAKEDPEELVERLWQTRDEAARFIDEMAERIVEARPRIVGCTSVFQQHCASIALLRRIKELDPTILSMLGGSNCEGEMGRTALVHFPWLDVVVSGEADDLIVPLCQMLLAEGPAQDAERFADGVFAHDHRRRWLAGEELTAGRHLLRDMGESPIPRYDNYYETLAGSPVAKAVFPGLPIETSRGCWWGQKTHCTFCGIENGSLSFRSKPAERVLEEMDELYRRHGIPRFKVVDLILDMGYFRDLLPRLSESERDYTLFYEVKPNLSKERVRTLRDAGVEWIQPGFESLHDGALGLMRKGNTAAVNLQTLKWAREEGIYVIWSILTEVPGEDPLWFREMAEMIDRIVHLQPPMGWNSIAYHRFSPYQTMPESFGLELAASWMHYFVYPLAPAAMQGIAYRFQDVKDLGLAPGERPPIPGVEAEIRSSKPAMALLDAIQRWRAIFWSRVPPIMALTDFGDRCEIFDTRPCAESQNLTLEGLAYSIYRACDTAQTPAALAKALAGIRPKPPEPQEVEATLADLVERRLMLQVSGRYLALATEGDVPTLPRGRQYPGGFVSQQNDEYVLMQRPSADAKPKRKDRTPAMLAVAVVG